MGVAILFVLPMIGGLAPSYWLRHRIKVRRERVTNDLPDLLDLMTISVAAGLGLEQAMQVSCARFESPVCTSCASPCARWSSGLSRHDALENMKLRTDIDDLVTFAVVLSQADALGLPIGRVLQAQADEMRDKRRQRAREKAAKVPVKILFPLALCFLPAILIIVLGPIVGPIKHAFGRPLSRVPQRRGLLPPGGHGTFRPGCTRAAIWLHLSFASASRTMTRGNTRRSRWGRRRTGGRSGAEMRGSNGEHCLDDPVVECRLGRAGPEPAGGVDVLLAGFRVGATVSTTVHRGERVDRSSRPR